MSNQFVKVLIVEDNPQDAELIVDALGLQQQQCPIARDGVEAMDVLVNADRVVQPCLVLLDLKLPRLDGFEVLRRIKNGVHTKNIPVVVFTSSDLESDIKKAYELGANSYVAKPSHYETFTETVSKIGNYWLNINRPPRGDK